ncbi:TetR/AcrR family transcriptional regulator [Undibacterium sp. CY18W]|uniref:TetR/AcrR family transcriptional regulator n=1 Tax=Undibacterium hunanense TaxID=2762292 RepID=A0ABR6ZVB1_9BURK|nr:TetR/AcrR family transcriptional regulator [Undibacterium hunanense]MBC3919574.1 TetR/AcrR family transcriptional regulator [Undibacterium hunanense]
MKVSREQANENRERILNVAAQLFREHGFDGVSVVDLMKGAGLTHGGFYGNFSSKEDLIAKTCARSLGRSADRWKRWKSESPETTLSRIVADYLSPAHRDAPGRGCALAALGSDMGRQGDAVRKTASKGAHDLIGVLAELLPGDTETEKEDQAMAAFASMVGAVMLARAVDDAGFSQRILQAVAVTLEKQAVAVKLQTPAV